MDAWAFIASIDSILTRSFKGGGQQLPFAELKEFDDLLRQLPAQGSVESLCEISHQGVLYPVKAVKFGSDDCSLPTVCVVGGVHGLERIGSTVTLAFLRWFMSNLNWDESFKDRLTKMRVLFIPILNPVGMHKSWRSNANGVDLMRNSPIQSADVSRWFLAGGHRISPKLPWYRGSESDAMQLESAALFRFVEREVFSSKCGIVLDVHSGFGFRDRLWFPYAHSRKPVPDIADFYALSALMNQSLPDHVYRMEPQSHAYTTHGDLWDFMHLQRIKAGEDGSFMPLCLEMGSWSWIRKNPRQLFTRPGVFNPVMPHRSRRIRRRHLQLFDFLLRSSMSWKTWMPQGEMQQNDFKWRGLSQWYGKVKPMGLV
jgi:hypothetical protein